MKEFKPGDKVVCSGKIGVLETSEVKSGEVYYAISTFQFGKVFAVLHAGVKVFCKASDIRHIEKPRIFATWYPKSNCWLYRVSLMPKFSLCEEEKSYWKWAHLFVDKLNDEIKKRNYLESLKQTNRTSNVLPFELLR
jgi:hypothetical protein